MTKTKIINDPVHGFINIPSALIQKLIEHPYLQRLRNIKQLGLTYLVYPGACHNRFQHTLGAIHLMEQAISTLKAKGHTITDEEHEAALATILLHDAGHGPFSHSLERKLVNVDHERISLIVMEKLNKEFNGKLNIAIDIFTGKYHKGYLNSLVSSQLDVDRLDYLLRDSFFSGVVEGMIGVDRLIKMMDIVDDKLVMEAKAIYSIEKFLLSRRLMYWQVYLHKTVISAEQLLIKIVSRAKLLTKQGYTLFASPSLQFFLSNNIEEKDLKESEDIFKHFIQLADSDLETSIKVWTDCSDKVLSTLCKMLVDRRLPRAELQENTFDADYVQKIKKQVKDKLDLTDEEVSNFVIEAKISNKPYTSDHSIIIKTKDKGLTDIYNASNLLKFGSMEGEDVKYVLCYPKLT